MLKSGSGVSSFSIFQLNQSNNAATVSTPGLEVKLCLDVTDALLYYCLHCVIFFS